jgi:hypothetical protein
MTPIQREVADAAILRIRIILHREGMESPWSVDRIEGVLQDAANRCGFRHNYNRWNRKSFEGVFRYVAKRSGVLPPDVMRDL